MSPASDGNIDSLQRAVMDDARSEADTIVAEAQAKAEAIRAQAQEEAARMRKEILDRANADAQRIRGQVVATSQLKARTMQLEHREKLLEQVFQRTRQELPTVQQWTDYTEIAENLLREAVLQLLGGNLVVHADKKTQTVLSDRLLRDLSKELNIEIKKGDPLEQGTGVLVETENGHLQFDNTLEARLERMQNQLRTMVYKVLMGESL